MDLHKDDVWAVGVMGLLWVSKGQDLPFGPTRQQATKLDDKVALGKAQSRVAARHAAWVSNLNFSHLQCLACLPVLDVWAHLCTCELTMLPNMQSPGTVQLLGAVIVPLMLL